MQIPGKGHDRMDEINIVHVTVSQFPFKGEKYRCMIDSLQIPIHFVFLTRLLPTFVGLLFCEATLNVNVCKVGIPFLLRQSFLRIVNHSLHILNRLSRQVYLLVKCFVNRSRYFYLLFTFVECCPLLNWMIFFFKSEMTTVDPLTLLSEKLYSVSTYDILTII